MKAFSTSRLSVVLSVLLFACLADMLPTSAADPAAQLTAKYYEAAKKEGKVVIYGLGPPFLGPITEAFNKRYPGIQIEAFDEQGRETRERVIAEQKAGRVIGDVVVGGASLHQVLLDLGFLEPYQSLQLPFIIPELITEGGFTNPFRATIVSLAINTKLVPDAEEPKMWADVLSQKFNGRIAADDPRGSGNGGSLMASLELAFGTEFLHKLAAQNIFFGKDEGMLLTSLVRGEHALFLSAHYDDIVVARKGGAPVKFLKPQDGVRVGRNSQSIIKNAPHPNAAKLWVEWSLSEPGQQVLGAHGLVPTRKGVAAAVPEANLIGVKLLPIAETKQDMTYLKERTKRMEAIFFKKN